MVVTAPSFQPRGIKVTHEPTEHDGFSVVYLSPSAYGKTEWWNDGHNSALCPGWDEVIAYGETRRMLAWEWTDAIRSPA